MGLVRPKVTTLKYPDQLETVEYSPKSQEDTIGGKLVLTGCRDRVCRLQTIEGNTLFQFTPANRGVFSADGKTILTGNTDGTTKAWRLDANQTPPGIATY
ncbi:MAG: hypothetical protein IPH31_14385 [Lewinellaceae bacterium]|nr:hypothetical protein [Lewinellaceae bacterium]